MALAPKHGAGLALYHLAQTLKTMTSKQKAVALKTPVKLPLETNGSAGIPGANVVSLAEARERRSGCGTAMKTHAMELLKGCLRRRLHVAALTLAHNQ